MTTDGSPLEPPQPQPPHRAPLPGHGRYVYSAITRRPVFRWPNGRKLAVYFALGLEHYAFAQGKTEDLVPGMPQPDVLNTSWREYGNRVGAWRVLDCFTQLGFTPAILLNSAVCELAPELIAACTAAGCEMIAHGYSNSDSLHGLAEDAEAAYLRRVAGQIEAATGHRPEGWASPWIAETLRTPDLLHEVGYGYLLDWCMDDQPIWMNTRLGRILSVPYSQELNDSSAIIGRQTSAAEFADMIVDQFDEMAATAGDEPLVMSVILHAFISGQPFRLRALRRALEHIHRSRGALWLTQPGAIARHFQALPTIAGTR
jgi:peptidoglycan/xylan/chitin deacetylase (PgdA/CDA1 family)